MILTTQFNDAIQYFVGKKFWKHKLCHKINPNKTIEGVINTPIVKPYF
ncbi:phosphatidate cytidylyltransferase [Photobacterium angustum]